MGLDSYWFLSNRIIMVQIEGDVLAEDLRGHAIHAMLENANEPVHILLSERNINKRPKLPDYRKAEWLSHPTVGDVVIYGLEQPSIERVWIVVSRLFGKSIQVVPTITDALASLNATDSTLPDFSHMNIEDLIATENRG